MSPADQPNEHSPQSSGTGRRRGRLLLPLAFAVAVILIMTFIWLVQWLGR